jgi:hypothetical protein
LLVGLFVDKSLVDITDWLALRSRETRPLLINPLTGQVLPEPTVASDFDIARAPVDDLQRLRTIHNERVKLNATFCNSLAVWFAGAGAAGALINTLMASGAHNFAGAGEIGAAGMIIAIVLKWLANREIGKLR